MWGNRKVYGFDGGRYAEGVPQKQMAWLLGVFFLAVRGAGLHGSGVSSSELLYLKVPVPPYQVGLCWSWVTRAPKACAWGGIAQIIEKSLLSVPLPSCALFPLFLSSFASVEFLSHLEPFWVHPVLVLLISYTLWNSKLFSKLSRSLQMTWNDDTCFPCFVFAQVVWC